MADANVPDFKKIKLINCDYAKYGSSTERKRLIARWEKGVNSLPRSAMATVREGSKGVLVVVDVQVGVMNARGTRRASSARWRAPFAE